MRAATEGNLPPVMPQGNLVEVLGPEVRQGSPGELTVESSPSRQRWPSCKSSKEMSDEAADAAALTYLLTQSICYRVVFWRQIGRMEVQQTEKSVPSGPSTSWARNRINVFRGPIFKRRMIRQHLDSIGANPGLVFFQSADYDVHFLLTRRPLHLACA